MSSYVETMFSSDRQIPWMGMIPGVTVVEEKAVNKREALRLSKTNWKVFKAPLYAEVGEDEFSPLPSSDRWALVRSSDKRILSVVGRYYEPVQNEETAEFCENVLDVGEALFVTGGSLDTPLGVIVWYCLKLPKSVKVGRMRDEKMDVYISVINPHALGALRILVSPIRIVCFNTMNAAIRSAQSEFTIRHTKNAKSRIAEAREALGITYEYLDGFQKEAEELLSKKANANTVMKTVEHIWPQPKKDEGPKAKTRWQNRRDEILYVWNESPNLENVRPTHYGVYNAMTEWAQWGRKFKGSAGQQEKIDQLRGQEVLFGHARDIGEKSFEFLRETPGVGRAGKTLSKSRRLVKR